jgi:hypothetical protein
MPLQKLQFRPGINRDVTSYSNEGGWVDGNKIRFRLGYPEKIGGWAKYTANSFLGVCRALHNWIGLDGSNFLGVGTHLKYYIEEGGGFNDITPLRSTTAAGDVTFAATNGSSVITVTDTNHGAIQDDFVTFSGAASLGGNITANILNDINGYQVISVPSSSTYTIDVGTAASGADTGNGGSSVVGAYQINVGLNSQVGGTGWGAGTWGRGGWGSGSSLTTTTQIRIWSHDNFGEDLIINPRDSNVYYWDKGGGLGARAVELSTLSGAKSVPQVAKQVLVSDSDRHVIAFGCDGLGASSSATQGNGTQDPLLIRFSSQENATDWYPTTTNTAGDLLIGSGSTFVQAIETKREVLVWSDTSLHSMKFIGPPFTFGIQQITGGITIMGPNAAAATEDFVFWMGIDNFYVYAGQTQQLDSPVKDFVFNDFNFSQTDKVWAAVNSEFSEVIWLYPSETNSLGNGGTGENDRYVIYNYKDQIWYYGTINRSAWIDRGTRTFPLAAEAGYLYNQEFEYDDDGSPMDSFIESAPMDIEDGDRFSLVTKVIPDMTFQGSTSLASPQATFTLKARTAPGNAYGSTDTGTTVRLSSSPIETFTDELNLRVRGRTFAVRIDSSALGTKWKLGSPRVNIRPDGKR